MDINKIEIRASTEYPEIVGATNDPKTVGILKDLLSSRISEVTAIMQYFYQSRIAKGVEDDISSLLEEIAIVEMEHMELLMDAIISFGGTPIYTNSKGQYFNASYVNYATKLKDMLDSNIFSEQQAINDYSNAQNMVNNKSLKDLFARIIEDEQMHLKVFKTFVIKSVSSV